MDLYADQMMISENLGEHAERYFTLCSYLEHASELISGIREGLIGCGDIQKEIGNGNLEEFEQHVQNLCKDVLMLNKFVGRCELATYPVWDDYEIEVR